MSLATYARAVHATRLRVEAAVRMGNAPNIGPLRQITLVRLPDSRIVHVNTLDVTDLLSSRYAADGDEGLIRLEGIDEDLQGASPRYAAQPKLHQLDVVLAGQAFHPRRNAWQRFQDWVTAPALALWNRIKSFLSQAFQSGSRAVTLNPLVELAFLAGLLLCAGAIAYLFASGALSQGVAEARPAQSRDDPSRPSDALARAEEYASGGNFRFALRFLFLALLLDLERRGHLDTSPGRTNRQYLQLLTARISDDEIRNVVQDLVDAFDRSWYGHVPLTEAEYRHLHASALRVMGERRGLVA